MRFSKRVPPAQDIDSEPQEPPLPPGGAQQPGHAGEGDTSYDTYQVDILFYHIPGTGKKKHKQKAEFFFFFFFPSYSSTSELRENNNNNNNNRYKRRTTPILNQPPTPRFYSPCRAWPRISEELFRQRQRCIDHQSYTYISNNNVRIFSIYVFR